MYDIQIEHLKIVQNNIGNGITEPKLASLDDDTLVVVKLFNGPEGSLVLFNEYFCYRLAILLGLDMPVSGICLLDSATIIYNDCVLSDHMGYAFYSTYIKKAVIPNEAIIGQIKNKEDFYKLLLFDHIIFNKDRNPGNLLVQYYKKNIVFKVIDHSHVFVNEAIWDRNCLKMAREDQDYRSTHILENNEYMYSMFFHNLAIDKAHLECFKELFQKKVSADNMRRIIDDIPSEWMPKPDDVEELLIYLCYRVKHFDDICETIVNFIR